MLKGRNKFRRVFLLAVIILLSMGAVRSFARQVITFGPGETSIKGSIKYSVIGRYTAGFNSFRGSVVLDERPPQVRSVYLEIDVKSIASKFAWCDRFARSRRLLNAARYPQIIFKSDKIFEDDRGYEVKGVLQMHGIKRKMLFPFKVKTVIDPVTRRKWLDIKGSWNVDRKDFNIIWNKVLDHGGVLVGDIFTVEWGIRVGLK